MATSSAIGSRRTESLELETVALRHLWTKEPSEWEGGDLLTVALLAFSAPRTSLSLEKWTRHATGFYEAMQASSRSHGYSLRECWPMARDLVIGFLRWELDDSVFFEHFVKCSGFIQENNFQHRPVLAFDKLEGLCLDLGLHIELTARAIRTRIRHIYNPNIAQ